MSRPGRVRRRASPSTPVQTPSSARNQLVRAPLSLLRVHPRCRVLWLIFFLVSVLIITAVTCVVYFYFFISFFFFVFLIWLSGPPYLVNKQTTLLGRRIPFEAKCVSDDTPLPGKDKAKNSKHKNSHRCMGKREKRVNGHRGPQEVFQC